ncbi:hypothetical protein PLESTB_001154700 [Pleodorina starrii]|uniref:Uncharacterized protein n=1 Tax=Pleodorina starrii TaxID=330485 RepID=A0A9W6BR54_9CHLO|nr:hypothetical protein PLESTM_001781200 [Pleodorina starrii]GLC56839.1 hypothetical protein PLESTB_001154700 [Pleodorina starrii]GLC68173.1 hypothetical protein PLESTF_000656400 [Pleodorina starrii]
MAHVEGCSRSGGRPFALVWSPIPLISWLMPFIGHIGVCSSTGRTFDFAGPFTVNEDRLLFGKATRYLQLNPAQATRPSRRGAAPAAADANASTLGRRDGLGSGSDIQREDVEAGMGLLSGIDDGAAGMAAPPSNAAGAAKMRWMGGQPGPHVEVWAGSGGAGDAAGAAAAAATGPAAAAHSWDNRLAFAATAYRLLNYNLMTNNCHCFVAHFLNQLGYRGGGWDMVNLAALMFVRGRYSSSAGLAYTWLPWLLLVALGSYFGGLLFLFSYAAVCAPLLTWFLLYTWCCWRDLSL